MITRPFIFDCLTKKDTDILQKLQNGACRIILKKPKRSSTKDMHEELHFHRLADRRHMHTMEYMYRVVNKLVPDNICSLFKLVSDIHNRQTKLATGMDLYLPNLKLEMSKRDIRYRGPMYWNMVDDNIRKSPTLASFRYHLRKSDIFK